MDFNEILTKNPIVIDNVIRKESLENFKRLGVHEGWKRRRGEAAAEFSLIVICQKKALIKRLNLCPNSVGRPKYRAVLPTAHQAEYQIGIAKEETRGLLKLKYPMSHGIINNWNDMELIWKYIYQELKANPKEFPVLVTEPPLSPLGQKFQLAQIFFENFSVPAFFLAVQGVLSLFASGKTTGIVLDSGDGVSHCVPVFEGFSLQHAATRSDLGGRDITEHLMLLLRRSGYAFNTSSEFELVKKIKEKRCFFGPAPPTDDKYMEKKEFKDSYVLPDGNVIELSFERTRAPEILFSPDKIGLECNSLPELLVGSISKTDIDLRKTLYSEIVLAGGTTLIQGFPERFLTEVKKMVPKDLKIKIYAPAERNYLCWVGGSILSNLTSFKNLWITKKEWEEDGERLLLKKSF